MSTTYKLNKREKNGKFEYTVTDENGTIITKRTSARNYVACTIRGRFYFGRLDLIGKGDHGKILNKANLILSDPKQAYNEDLKVWNASYRNEWKSKNPFERWLTESTEWANKMKSEFDAIAYL